MWIYFHTLRIRILKTLWIWNNTENLHDLTHVTHASDDHRLKALNQQIRESQQTKICNLFEKLYDLAHQADRSRKPWKSTTPKTIKQHEDISQRNLQRDGNSSDLVNFEKAGSFSEILYSKTWVLWIQYLLSFWFSVL